MSSHSASQSNGASDWYSDPAVLLTELRRSRAALAAPAKLVIAGYDDIVELRRGGQGVVYAALQKSTRRRVAIKVLLDGAFASRASRRRFEREIELVATLDHPGIVRVYDSGLTEDDRLYLVMEFIEGRPLDEHVRELPQRDVKSILGLFAGIADAVQFAHQRGVIHRDLKPSNIRVDAQGRPHILDFGLAKLADDGAEPAESFALSMSGQFIGSAPWASPEQAEGTPGRIDTRTDVYALGVMLYHALTGRFPYDVSGPIRKVMDRIINDEPARPSLLRTDIDDEVQTILLKSLSKEPARRYQSAGALAEDLKAYLAGEPIQAKRDSAWYTMRKTLRRYRVVAAAAALIMLSLGAGLVLTIWQAGVARQQESVAQKRFDEVRKLAKTFLFEVHDSIAPLTGSRPARELLVTTSMGYLETLAAEAGDDPDLQLEIAQGWQRIADVQGNPFMPNLGRTAEAMESAQRGLAMTRQVLVAHPDHGLARKLEAEMVQRVGDLKTWQGDYSGALADQREALAKFEALSAAKPDDLSLQRTIGTCHLKIGDTLSWTKDQAQQLAEFQAAAAVFERMITLPQTEVRDRFNLKVCLSKMGFTLGEMQKHDEALAMQQRALGISIELSQANPNNESYRRSIAIDQNQVGSMLMQMERWDEALEHFNAALTIAQDQVAADPKNALAKSDVTYTHNKIGELHFYTRRYDDALAHFRAALDIRRALVALDSTNAGYQRGLVVSFIKVGETHWTKAHDESLPKETRLEAIGGSISSYEEGLAQLEMMKAAGTLSEVDAEMPAEVRQYVADCKAYEAELQGAQ